MNKLWVDLKFKKCLNTEEFDPHVYISKTLNRPEAIVWATVIFSTKELFTQGTSSNMQLVEERKSILFHPSTATGNNYIHIIKSDICIHVITPECMSTKENDLANLS